MKWNFNSSYSWDKQNEEEVLKLRGGMWEENESDLQSTMGVISSESLWSLSGAEWMGDMEK